MKFNKFLIIKSCEIDPVPGYSTAASVTSLTNSGSVPSYVSSIKSNFKLKTRKPEILPNSSLFPVNDLV